MVERLTIGEASGRRVIKPSGTWAVLGTYDPFGKVWFTSGYSQESKDSVTGLITDDELLKEYGIEIAPSVEELIKIEDLRLSSKITREAAALSSTIRAWLQNQGAR